MLMEAEADAAGPVSGKEIWGEVNVPPVSAPISRARPTWQKQSVRLLVTSTSRIFVGPFAPGASRVDSMGKPAFMSASATSPAWGVGERYSAIQSRAIFIGWRSSLRELEARTYRRFS